MCCCLFRGIAKLLFVFPTKCLRLVRCVELESTVPGAAVRIQGNKRMLGGMPSLWYSGVPSLSLFPGFRIVVSICSALFAVRLSPADQLHC